MAKKKIDYGECVGKCKICTINLWSSNDGKPVFWPCNIKDCPYEDPDKQNLREELGTFSLTGSGLAQIE